MDVYTGGIEADIHALSPAFPEGVEGENKVRYFLEMDGMSLSRNLSRMLGLLEEIIVYPAVCHASSAFGD